MRGQPEVFGQAAASESKPLTGPRLDAVAQAPPDGLTPAQARALSRCAPLSPAQFKARGHVADKGLASLHNVVDHARARGASSIPEA